MSIIPTGSLNPHGAPILRQEVITNSATTAVHDSIKMASGFATRNTAGVLTAGHVTAHVSAKGVGLNTTGAAGAEMGSYVGTFAAASDNQTVAQVAVVLDISKATIYSADPDATIASTTGSNLSGYYTDLADHDTTDEDTAATTSAQYGILGVDPLDSGNQLVHIHESLFWGV